MKKTSQTQPKAKSILFSVLLFASTTMANALGSEETPRTPGKKEYLAVIEKVTRAGLSIQSIEKYDLDGLIRKCDCHSLLVQGFAKKKAVSLICDTRAILSQEEGAFAVNVDVICSKKK